MRESDALTALGLRRTTSGRDSPVLLLRVLTILTATEPEPWLADASAARDTWGRHKHSDAAFSSKVLHLHPSTCHAPHRMSRCR